MDNLAACPNCGRMPQLDPHSDERQHYVRLHCSCGFAAPWAETEHYARANWNRVAGYKQQLRSIGIAYSDYIRRPNEQTFMHLMDLARAALESEATA